MNDKRSNLVLVEDTGVVDVALYLFSILVTEMRGQRDLFVSGQFDKMSKEDISLFANTALYMSLAGSPEMRVADIPDMERNLKSAILATMSSRFPDRVVTFSEVPELTAEVSSAISAALRGE